MRGKLFVWLEPKRKLSPPTKRMSFPADFRHTAGTGIRTQTTSAGPALPPREARHALQSVHVLEAGQHRPGFGLALCGDVAGKRSRARAARGGQVLVKTRVENPAPPLPSA